MPLTCADYFCPTNGSCIKRPIQSVGLAPFVRMSFPALPVAEGENGKLVTVLGNEPLQTIDTIPRPDLTVGNNSNLPNNHAVIKSFQYGSSDGEGAEVEIFDEEGGEFDLFVNKLVKVLSDGMNYGCQIEWGWVITDCNDIGIDIRAKDGKVARRRVIKSSPHHFLIMSVDMTCQASGMSFKLSLLDLMEPLFDTRENDVFEGVTLKEAIRQLFTEKANPALDSVEFIRYMPSAGGQIPCNNLVDSNDMGNQTELVGAENTEEFFFHGALEASTAEKWECKNQTPLAAVQEWLKNTMTDREKGTIIFWNSVAEKPQLIIMEDPLPKCWDELDEEECSRSIGTYIVNGGKDSPVISFDPQIKFNFAAAAHAGAGVDDQTAEGKAEIGQPCEEGGGKQGKKGAAKPGDGDTTFIQMSEPFNQIYGPGNLKLALRGVAAQSRANKLYENIEAELKIQGDPSLDNPSTLKIKTVSIIFVNPFHLRSLGLQGPGFKGCPEWLVGPPCNQILSNKNWFIKGVSHEIKEGSYTTTIKLYLPAPGQTQTT